MTALLLTEVFPPKTGGSGRWFWELYRRLPEGSVIVAAGEHPGAKSFDAESKLQTVRLPLSFLQWGVWNGAGRRMYWQTAKRVRDLAREHKAQILHCGRCLPEGGAAWLLKRRLGLPYLCYVHGEELTYGMTSRELGLMMGLVMRGARVLIANSENTASILRRQWRMPADKVRVLHPGVDAKRFVPAERDEKIRARLGWEGRPTVLTVGRLQKRKGQDMLIRALPAIRERVPNVLYSIVGDGEERASLTRQVHELGVQEHVQFRGEPRDSELVDCYQQCDLFALPNREVQGDFEGFGMVLVEAQACGKPVIAGASGGTAETLLPEKTGRVVPCDGPELLAQAIIELLGNVGQREQMGRAARHWADSQFDWQGLLPKAQAIFSKAAPRADACAIKVISPAARNIAGVASSEVK